jgi:hypothetical protein
VAAANAAVTVEQPRPPQPFRAYAIEYRVMSENRSLRAVSGVIDLLAHSHD